MGDQFTGLSLLSRSGLRDQQARRSQRGGWEVGLPPGRAHRATWVQSRTLAGQRPLTWPEAAAPNQAGASSLVLHFTTYYLDAVTVQATNLL